ncbi:unnamed protein product [Debaryomyces tyrocola]|nr:unnamed protein product [Debaryomyces tyrocola]
MSDTKVEDLSNSHLMHRSLREEPDVVKNAKGSYIFLQNGQKVFDGCGGAAVIAVGHGNSEVIEAVSKQLSVVSYVHTFEYTTPVAEELANILLKNYNGKIAKVYFANSGSEANEAAVKVVVQYFYEQGKTSKTQFISRKQSYHGNCLAGMSLSGHVLRRKPFEDLVSDKFHKVSEANEYRGKRNGETTGEYVERLANELEEKILEVGPDNIAGFFAETIVGATTGCVTPPKGYFKAIQKVCEKYDVLLITDEIMCGSGRTGTFFAWEQEDFVPDITTSGKALGGGYSPLSAVFMNQKVVDVLLNGSASFNNGHTFQCYPLSCAAGIAVQKIIQRDNLLQNVKQMGDYLGQALVQELKDIKIVGNIRGRGLFWGVEFVKNKLTKDAIDPRIRIGQQIQHNALEKGLAVYPGFGTIDGLSGDHILIAPSYDITQDQVDAMVQQVAASIIEMEQKFVV